MPRFRNQRNRRRKRLYPRKRRFAYSRRRALRKQAKPSQVIIRQPSGVPDRLFVKMRLRITGNFSQAAGNLGYIQIAGNDLYDPLAASGTAQPYFFDQWTAMYGFFRVLGSKINVVSQLNDPTTGPASTIVGIVANGVATAPTWQTTDHSLIETQPYAKRSCIRAGARGVGYNIMSSYKSTAKIRGVKKSVVQNEDNYRGTSAASPTNLWWWTVFNYDLGGASMSLVQDILVTYYCIFEQRGIPPVSNV